MQGSSRALKDVAFTTCLALLTVSVAGSASAADVEFHRKYVDGRHGQVHVLISTPVEGDRVATPMACFAPNPSAGRYFSEFMKVLGRDRVMVAPDLPGLGDSDPPAEPLDMAGYAASMAETLVALGHGPDGKGAIDVCGYHTGAFVAIELAVSRPDLVRKVLLMGVPFFQGEAREKMYESTAAERPLKGDFESLRGSWDFRIAKRPEGIPLERAYDLFVDDLKPKQGRSWPFRATFTYPAEERAPLVKQPVLILNTQGMLKAQTPAIAPYLPTSKLIEVPELSTWIFDLGPEVLAGHARPFLE